MRTIAVNIGIILGYISILLYSKEICENEIHCEASCIDASSATYSHYTFLIDSVSNSHCCDIIGDKFILSDRNVESVDPLNVGDKICFRNNVVCFQIRNRLIFPFRFYYITPFDTDKEVLIGAK